MRPTFTYNFRIRFYECDVDGFLHRANYTRLMQEVAIDASADVGWDAARYDAIGKQWIVHSTHIEYFHPIRVNNKIQIKTWVEDFRRVRSLRIYEFRKEDESELVARAVTDWVLIDMKTLRPTQPPADMIAAFYPDYQNETSQFRQQFPTQPPPPETSNCLEKQVEWRDVDQLGHFNNSAYLDYLDVASRHSLSNIGWGWTAEKQANLRLVAHQQHIKYNQPALLDDVIEIITWISPLTPTVFLQHYRFVRKPDDTLLASARTHWGIVDRQTDTAIAIPQAIISQF